MPEYQVPQFIGHEAKIVGPLTFKQFIFIGGAGVILFMLFFTVGQTNLLLFLIIGAPIGGFAAALAFVKVGGRSFGPALLSMVGFFVSPRIFVWKKSRKRVPIIPSQPLRQPQINGEEIERGPLVFGEHSRLKSLSWKVETKTEEQVPEE